KQEEKQDVKQKVALHALQKQLSVLKLREILILASFILGAGLLRIPMQSIPSAEPITFFALLAGWLFGRKKGFLVGAGALITSNFFVFGGHGPWTLFQALGFGMAGYMGGFLKDKSGYVSAAIIAVVATIVFELILNVSSMFIFPVGFMVFLTALPFTIIHLVSNLLFSIGLPKARKLVHEKGEFNEKTICNELITKLKSSKLSGTNK
ncbi:MAG: ECF transporter S component, partial [Nanoarchaeota archaeon]|nr:ECF transporter S component [Nanoarchaeota archaeon]